MADCTWCGLWSFSNKFCGKCSWFFFYLHQVQKKNKKKNNNKQTLEHLCNARLSCKWKVSQTCCEIKYILHVQSIFQALDFFTVETTFSQTRWKKTRICILILSRGKTEKDVRIFCRERTVWRAVRGEKNICLDMYILSVSFAILFCRSFKMLCRLVMNMYLA